MLNKELNWFFVTFSNEFRANKRIAFETIIFLAIAHFFGFYNPKQVADFLSIQYQQLYKNLKQLSIYSVKKMLICFMANQAIEHLKPIMEKSNATKSRAAITLSVDNSVIDRLGKMLRCTWKWYSGRWKKVVNGNDLLGIVMTINGIAFPLHLLFCSKQGKANTDKPSLLITMLRQLIEKFAKQGINLTDFPITMDSWFVSKQLVKQLRKLGFKKIVIAGKGNYVFIIGNKKCKASEWKKILQLKKNQWGIDVPAKRCKASSPTFAIIVLFFFQKSTTRTYYLMDFSLKSLRSCELWRIWKQHHIIECFWKTLKSVLQIKSMRLQGNGLYTALLIKIISYLIANRLKSQKAFFKLSITQIMRKIRSKFDFKTLTCKHFHLAKALN